jgi:uncharacterized protein YkwD
MFSQIALCAASLCWGADPQTQAQPRPQPQIEARAQPQVETKAEAKTETKTEAKVQAEAQPQTYVVMHPIEESIVRLTNLERAKNGLPALEIDPELMKTAREQATWMTNNQRLVHTSRPVAENIAMGQQSGEEALRSWMNSPGHRANILSRGHGRIGVAAYRTAGGAIYWCQQFRR